MAATEKSSAWRAVATGLLAAWAAQPPVREALSTLLEDPEPLVRAAAVRALERAKDDREDAKRLLADPVRLVRIEAAWLLRRNLSLETRAGQDLTRHLGYIADQPQGALQSGLFHLDRGNPKGAKEWIRKAIAWDPASAPNRQALALVLESQGNAKEAVSQLAEACKLAPRDAEYPFALGLAQSAADSMEDAVRAFETACELDPRFARAWYNLGLARSRLARDAAAIDALRRAQAEDPDEPEYPFARAALHLRRKEIAEAREAALEALKIDPELEEAADLLAELNGSME